MLKLATIQPHHEALLNVCFQKLNEVIALMRIYKDCDEKAYAIHSLTMAGHTASALIIGGTINELQPGSGLSTTDTDGIHSNADNRPAHKLPENEHRGDEEISRDAAPNDTGETSDMGRANEVASTVTDAPAECQ